MSNATQRPKKVRVGRLRGFALYENIENEDKHKIGPDVLKYTDTKIDPYDDTERQIRWEWLLRFLDFDESTYVSGRVGQSQSKTHLLRTDADNDVYNNSGYTSVCHKEPYGMRIKTTTHVDLSDKEFCKFCLNHKQRFTAAKIALDRTGCLE